jgi:DNA-directed RNA polymerase specialized sigma subunit
MPAAATPRRTRQPKAKPKPNLGSFPPPTEISEQLAVENRMLAMDAANRFARACGMPVAELEMPAWVGLLKACRLFDPARGHKLSTIAVPYIKGAMKQFVRDKSFSIKFPHKWRELGPKVRRLSQSGLAADAIAAQIIAEGKSITAAEVDEILGCMRGTVEFDAEPLGDRLVDPASIAEQDDDAWACFDDCISLAMEAAKRLNKADREMIQIYIADPRRQSYPSGPMQQHDAKFRAILRDRKGPCGTVQPLGGVQTQPLGFDVIVGGHAVPRAPRRKVRQSPSAAELTSGSEQLGLFAMEFGPDTSGEP